MSCMQCFVPGLAFALCMECPPLKLHGAAKPRYWYTCSVGGGSNSWILCCEALEKAFSVLCRISFLRDYFFIFSPKRLLFLWIRSVPPDRCQKLLSPSAFENTYLPHTQKMVTQRLVHMKECWAHELVDGSFFLESLSHGWTSACQGVSGNLWPVVVRAPRLPLVPVGWGFLTDFYCFGYFPNSK